MDIIKLPIEYSKEVLDSRFRLVLIAAQRARQISDGSPVLVKSKYVKNTTLSLEEAIEGKLKYMTGEEARKARELEYRLRRERMAREHREEAAAASLEKMEEIKEAYKADTASGLEDDDVEDEMMTCPHCEGDMDLSEVKMNPDGVSLNCPHCRKKIVLEELTADEEPDEMEMSADDEEDGLGGDVDEEETPVKKKKK